MKKLDKILDYIEYIICGVCLCIMTLLTFANVVSCHLVIGSLSFSEEITNYLFVLVSLMGASIAAKRGSHLGFTLISDHVGKKGARIFGIIAMLFAAIFSAIICYYGVFMVMKQMGNGQVTAATQLPEWIFGSFVPVGALFITIRFAQNLVKLITGHDIEHEDVVADAIEAAEEAEKKGDNE